MRALMISAQFGTQAGGRDRRSFISCNNALSGVSAARLVVTDVPLISTANARGAMRPRAVNSRRPMDLISVSPRVIPQKIAINKATPRMRQTATRPGDKTTNRTDCAASTGPVHP